MVTEENKMIILMIWLVGIMTLWIFNMLDFNIRGYWIVSKLVMWWITWSVVLLAIYFFFRR